MTKYLNAMRNGFNFHGRASRSEFWLFFLITWVMSVITVTLDAALGFADEGALVLTGILYLVHIIPSLAVSVRRLHDIDKSGWWLLISFTGIGAPILLVMFCLAPTKGQNHYGPALDGTQAPDAHSGLYSAPEGQSQPRHA
ncbi:DUF805 domain-containing protein, partial [Sulfitobacter pseudonitzschiae]|nr:DUF805 domain-containing protein [Pseudosulfitobacter pseudonitzschiae]